MDRRYFLTAGAAATIGSYLGCGDGLRKNEAAREAALARPVWRGEKRLGRYGAGNVGFSETQEILRIYQGSVQGTRRVEQEFIGNTPSLTTNFIYEVDSGTPITWFNSRGDTLDLRVDNDATREKLEHFSRIAQKVTEWNGPQITR